MPRPAPPHVWRKGEDGDEGDNSRHLNSANSLVEERYRASLFNFRLSDNYVASILICLAHPHLPNSLPPRSVMYDALVV